MQLIEAITHRFPRPLSIGASETQELPQCCPTRYQSQTGTGGRLDNILADVVEALHFLGITTDQNGKQEDEVECD